MTLDKYLANRRYWEFGLIVLYVIVSFCANFAIEWIEFSHGGHQDLFEPLVTEATSHAAILLIVPLVLVLSYRIPIRADTWLSSIATHVLFSVLFSLLHVTLMYWGRVFIFSHIENPIVYRWSNWLGQFGYEYLKDFRTYILILALSYLYDFVLRRLRGEAGFLAEGKDEKEVTTLSDRFLVKKLGREFLVRIDEIDWIESSGNYVNLHVADRVYPLRETMTRIDERLTPLGFQRVHRGAIVNLDRISEIVSYDTGDGQARLRSDALVPISRRFRQNLRERLA
jgi:hypothetical protein